MTVIMATSFRDGIAIGADTLLHDPSTMKRVMNSAKTMLVGGRVGIAQAGTFTDTQSVWHDLEAMKPSNVTPKNVADLIIERSTKIHKAKIAKGDASVSRYLVAGYNPHGIQEIHSIEVDHNNYNCFIGEGQILALGTLPNITNIATSSVHSSLKLNSNIFKIDEWVQRIISAEISASPLAVGFPATLLLIRPHEVITSQIEEGQQHDPRLEGFFA